MKGKTKAAIIAVAVAVLLLAGCCTAPTGSSSTVNNNGTLVTTTTQPSFANCVDKAYDYLCDNRAAIEADLAAANTTITTIEDEYGVVIGAMPAVAQASIAAAQAVIALGQGILNSVNCPTDADVTNVNNASGTMNIALGKLNAERQMQGKEMIH